jgi:hypothetical protein
MTMFDNVNVNPEVLEFVLSYVVPFVLAALVIGAGIFGASQFLARAVAIWRQVYPLFNEPTDAGIIVIARLLKMKPEDVVAMIKLWNDQIDPPPQETAVQTRIGG